MEIRKLTEQDQLLLDLLKSAGSDWAVYYQPECWLKYLLALTASVTYIVIADNHCIAYIRCRDDAGFGIYIPLSSLWEILTNLRHPSQQLKCLK